MQWGGIRGALALCAAVWLSWAGSGDANAAVLVSQVNTETEITFDAVMPGVWGSAAPTSSGFAPTPINASPWDSDSWAARAGLTPNLTLPSDGTSLAGAVGFGGTVGAGNVSRGISTVAGFGTSGLGIASGLPTGRGFALRPVGNGTDNATVFLKIQNVTGQDMASWTIDYDAFYINIGLNATPVSFAYSTDGGVSFSTAVAGLGFTTPGTGSVTTPTVSDWTAVPSLSPTVINANVANNGFLILRWAMGTDITGDGNRVALDNISILGSPAVPEPHSVGMLLMGAGLVRMVRQRRRRRGPGFRPPES